MIRPYHSAPPDRYCRLFPHDVADVDDDLKERLTALAFSMLAKDDLSPIPAKILGSDPAHAGYTYFGQFIDHNLTEDDTPLMDSGKLEPWETFNYRGPWLNLSGIYSPNYDRGRWRDLFQNDGLSFRLGKPTIDGEEFDLPLDRTGSPAIADDRNNENIIVRQIHVMFLKLHNLAIKELGKRRGLTDAEKFARAQRRVCWQYQYLVRHDFLARICRKSVFEELVEKNQSQIDWSAGGFSIPIESAQAALRFGHSMIRPAYQINLSHSDIALRDLLSSGEARALEPDEAIHWPTFLTGEPAMLIDTAVASPLFRLESKDIHSFVDSPMPHFPHPLAVRTLLRGAQNGLPTGQDVARRMGVAPLRPMAQEIDGFIYDPGAHLESAGLTEATPLWYYILLEAEVNEKGATLGEVGSRLVIETVNGALRNDPDSYLSQKPNWTPEPWKQNGKPVLTLLDLAALVGLAR
jgi:hypothetical protein